MELKFVTEKNKVPEIIYWCDSKPFKSIKALCDDCNFDYSQYCYVKKRLGLFNKITYKSKIIEKTLNNGNSTTKN